MRKISIASGKGGTGKTTLATNLSYVMAQNGTRVAYVDTDVEEPNGHLFLRPEILDSYPVGLPVPLVQQEKCVHCGLCGQICAFSAIVCLENQVLVFPEMCHSCGGCWMVCPEEAITQTMREMGRVDIGQTETLQFVQGTLHVGEAMSPPVVRAAKEAIPAVDWVIVDAPPGASCPVIEALRGSDYVVLVTEPTPFGFHDLQLAVEMVRELKYPFGVVINLTDFNYSEVHEYCQRQQIPILAEIQDDRRVAEVYSQGKLVSEVFEDYREIFHQMSQRIAEELESAQVGIS